MERVASRISLLAWVYSLSASVVYTIIYGPGHTLSLMLGSHFGLGIKMSGVFLSFMMCRRIRPVLIWPLVFISLLALWKFYLGIIVFNMYPELKGFTFSQSCADWWQSNTSKLSSIAGTIVPAFFTLVSLVFWIGYGLLRLGMPEVKRDDEASLESGS